MKETLLQKFIEKHFSEYFEYYLNETDTITALKKSFENGWSFETCKEYF
jgi:hypothetical protein